MWKRQGKQTYLRRKKVNLHLLLSSILWTKFLLIFIESTSLRLDGVRPQVNKIVCFFSEDEDKAQSPKRRFKYKLRKLISLVGSLPVDEDRIQSPKCRSDTN